MEITKPGGPWGRNGSFAKERACGLALIVGPKDALRLWRALARGTLVSPTFTNKYLRENGLRTTEDFVRFSNFSYVPVFVIFLIFTS